MILKHSKMVLVQTRFCGEWNLEFGSNTTEKFKSHEAKQLFLNFSSSIFVFNFISTFFSSIFSEIFFNFFSTIFFLQFFLNFFSTFLELFLIFFNFFKLFLNFFLTFFQLVTGHPLH